MKKIYIIKDNMGDVVCDQTFSQKREALDFIESMKENASLEYNEEDLDEVLGDMADYWIDTV